MKRCTPVPPDSRQTIQQGWKSMQPFFYAMYSSSSHNATPTTERKITWSRNGNSVFPRRQNYWKIHVNTLSSRNNKFWHTSCRVDVTEDDRVVYCKVVVSFPLFLLVTQIPETAANMSFNHHVVFSHVSPTSFLTIWRIICCFPRRF